MSLHSVNALSILILIEPLHIGRLFALLLLLLFLRLELFAAATRLFLVLISVKARVGGVRVAAIRQLTAVDLITERSLEALVDPLACPPVALQSWVADRARVRAEGELRGYPLDLLLRVLFFVHL